MPLQPNIHHNLPLPRLQVAAWPRAGWIVRAETVAADPILADLGRYLAFVSRAAGAIGARAWAEGAKEGAEAGAEVGAQIGAAGKAVEAANAANAANAAKAAAKGGAVAVAGVRAVARAKAGQLV